MSTDTMRSAATGIKLTHATVRQLLERAARDTDPVSTFPDGTSFEDAHTCIFVVKGQANISYLCAVLSRQGLLDITKPVAP